MNTEQFNTSMTKLLNEATKILASAEKEYATDYDRLSNFKSIPGVDPELVCFIYLGKHIDGIRNYVTGRARSQRDSIRGRIHDALNYLILLNAIIEEKNAIANESARDLMFGERDKRDEVVTMSVFNPVEDLLFCSKHQIHMSRTADTPWQCPKCAYESEQLDKDNRSKTDRRADPLEEKYHNRPQ